MLWPCPPFRKGDSAVWVAGCTAGCSRPQCKRTVDKRGWGLFAKEPVSKGQFLIEYMGEVVNKKGYEKRKKDYAQEFNTYFMQLSTQPFEMIDASRKSSMGR